MECVEFIKNWGGHILSSFGVIGGLILYFKHDRKIKSHEEKLLKLQVEEKLQAKEDAKKADVKLNLVRHSGSSCGINIFNAGMSSAKNVRVEIIDKDKLFDIYFNNDEWGPYNEITPRYSSIEERFTICKGATNQFSCIVRWDDEYQVNRMSKQTIYLR